MTLRYPNLRAELIDNLEQLGNSDGLRANPGWLDFAIHFLLDDTPLSTDSLQTVGAFLCDEGEARAVEALIRKIEAIFEANGTEHPDEFFLSLPEWAAVADLAAALASALKRRDPGHW